MELFDWAGERDADMPRFLVYLLSGAAAEHRKCGQYSERDRDGLEQAQLLAIAMLNVEPDSPRVRATEQGAQAMANAHMCNDVVWQWIERTARGPGEKAATHRPRYFRAPTGRGATMIPLQIRGDEPAS